MATLVQRVIGTLRPMAIYFGHKTAELLLDALPIEDMEYSDISSIRNCNVSRSGFSQLNLSALADIPQPYDVLVSSPKEIRHWSGIRCHLCSAQLPEESFIQIAPEVFVASPALCFVLRARDLSLPQSIMLGSRFCGTFALNQSKTYGMRKRPPLITPDNLLSFSERCVKVHGAKRARIAAQYILPSSASPMESAVSLVLSLPSRLGGFGFKKPELNTPIRLGGIARQMFEKNQIRIDIYWPNYGFGVEYQGELAHTSKSDIAADIARQLAAECSGVDLQFVTKKQFTNAAQRNFLAQKIARCINGHVPAGSSFQMRNDALVRDLFGV